MAHPKEKEGSKGLAGEGGQCVDRGSALGIVCLWLSGPSGEAVV